MDTEKKPKGSLVISQRNPMADVTGVRNHFSRHSKKPVSRFFPFVSKGLVAKVAQELDGCEQKTEVKSLWASSSRTPQPWKSLSLAGWIWLRSNPTSEGDERYLHALFLPAS